MLTKQTTNHELELKMVASKLSLHELNVLIDQCLDGENYTDAEIYAKIYTRRRGMLGESK
jgi:SOS response regulatory protein OraA/RecX